MQSIFPNALSGAVAKHNDLSATRRETLSWLALLIMQHGTICLWRLAAFVASAAPTGSGGGGVFLVFPVRWGWRGPGGGGGGGPLGGFRQTSGVAVDLDQPGFCTSTGHNLV